MITTATSLSALVQKENHDTSLKSMLPCAHKYYDAHIIQTVTSWKEGLNSDGQQFNHHKQNKQSPITSNNWIQKEHDI